MDIKSTIRSITLTSFSLLIASTALAEVDNTNCPNGNTDINQIVEWEEESDGTMSPKEINHQAKIITKKGEFNCQVQGISPYGHEWIIKCNNGSTITQKVLRGIHVEDKLGRIYKMEHRNSKITTTCKENEVTYQHEVTAYQKSFDFDIIIESTYKRKKTPPPAGF